MAEERPVLAPGEALSEEVGRFARLLRALDTVVAPAELLLQHLRPALERERRPLVRLLEVAVGHSLRRSLHAPPGWPEPAHRAYRDRDDDHEPKPVKPCAVKHVEQAEPVHRP